MDLTVPSRPPVPLSRQSSGTGPAPPGTGRPGELPPVHSALICVALPSFAVSAEHGQLTGHGLEGVYQSGRRVLARCRLRVAGRDPVTVQGRLVSADRVRYVAVVRTPADPGPDPGVGVERTRDADGTERITFRSSAGRTVHLPVEIALGTDLADLGAIAAGRSLPELRATVHDSGLRWSAPDGGHATVTADPPPEDTLASAGLLRWELELRPGAPRTIELRVRSARPVRPVARTGGHGLPDARAEGDDPRVEAFLRTALGDLRALLVRDPAHPADVYPAAGVPWRCGPAAPAEALWAARMALPLGTHLAAATLRTLARTQLTGPGPGAGRIPGPLRDSGPHLPPSCTGTEATLAFPTVLAEARCWGLADQDLAELLPAAERCLQWLRATAGESGLLPEPGPAGLLRAETQAHAHRAALLGADLLEACGRPGAEGWRDWAHALRHRFREDFWLDDRAGGRPAAARTPEGRPLPHLGGGAAHLLDTGLLGGGRFAEGLLDKVQTEQLARLLGSPALDSGWGLRSLGSKEPAHNPFGHRAGAVRVHETAVAVTGLAAAGYEKEATSLLRGVLDAAEAFAYRLPEMYAGDQRTTDSTPVPHPAACRPAAVASAAAVQLLTTVAGIRPDVPAGTVALHPVRCAPLGAIRLSGLCVAGMPFAVRVSRLGLGMVEEAAPGLQLGV
ncbi:glycogen debranching N-terminal domain-containing protein [Streptomyces ficellus]|uniref:Glycogen debranching N-terminal domain-containing protein n=1 Tax=Streptomyces ficellus TaxID=1977088 RepID=A0ABT7YZP5_9ACTN|nr:glycogen debranching N-terminal domain-containing protein [Streptomyces ficellus]MDN3292681.1 glycogen debranching N-terminal domain-containing protein [Streptomyces ficellus]